MTFTLTFESKGFQPAIKTLRGIGSRATGSLREPMEVVAHLLASLMQDTIRSEGQRLNGEVGAWPAHHPATRAIHRHYGHGGRLLVRDGTFLHSIEALGAGDDYAEAGSRQPFAAILHTGGVFRGRRIPARPWLATTGQDREDIAEMLLTWITSARLPA